MSKTQRMYRPGFTLLELLVVMAIIIALFALLLPAMMSRQEKSRINESKIKIGQFENNLELYSTENRGYPTTEQGLMALLYIPDNAGMLRSTMPMQQGMQTGVPGGEMNSAFGGGDAIATGPGMLAGNTGAPAPMTMPQGTNPMADPMLMQQGTNPMADPMAMSGVNSGANPMDPMNPGAMTGSTTGWNQPTYNPAIYTQLRKRPQPYIDKEQDLIDPWGTPYRYENNLQFNGVYGINRTGTAKPAIWSAGPDRQDGTDDDICNWDPMEAQQLLAQHQQRMQSGGMTGGTGNPMDPMNPGTMDPMNPMQQPGGAMDPMNPMQQPGGAMNPMNPMQQPGPMNPMQPNTANPVAPQGPGAMTPMPPMTPPNTAPQPPMTMPQPPGPTQPM